MSFQAQYIQEGQAIYYTPSAAVDAGDVVVIGNKIVGIAKLDIAASALGALALEGVFDIVRADTIAFTAGDAVYWDADGDPDGGTAGTGAATDTDDTAANILIGYALADVADAVTNLTVRVRKINV